MKTDADASTPDALFVSSRPQRVYGQRTSIQHWQLRDLVHAHGEHEVFCVDQHRTLCYNTAASMASVAQTLSFGPTAMTASHGYLAAGGQRSYLDVRRISDGECLYKGPVGGSVNNALHITSGPCGEAWLLACNNDHTVKVFGLPSMRALGAVACPVAANYAALSPDGQQLVVVGDSPDVHLVRTTPTGFRPDTACKGFFTDAGMACAWSPSGSCVAAASQDGQVRVWEPRSGRAVAGLRTRIGACRAVKYSAGGCVDLLAFSEHSDTVHLADARALHQRQVLEMAPVGSDGRAYGGECNISGLSFTPSGQRLYVGLEGGLEEGIAAFDVKMLSRLTFGAGQLN